MATVYKLGIVIVCSDCQLTGHFATRPLVCSCVVSMATAAVGMCTCLSEIDHGLCYKATSVHYMLSFVMGNASSWKLHGP
jgi:hypothetical protein